MTQIQLPRKRNAFMIHKRCLSSRSSRANCLLLSFFAFVGFVIFVSHRTISTIPASPQRTQEDATFFKPKVSLIRKGELFDSSRVLFPLPEITMPPLDPKSRLPLNISAIDLWASVPIVGSYRHQHDDTSMSRVHMPLMDLQSYYKGTPPDLSSLRPEVTNGRSFPSPECVVLTRKGNKFSQTGVRSNQDRIAISDYLSSNGKVEEFWMGLFDGHGELGHVISHFAISEFPKELERLRHKSLSVEDTKAALKDLFLNVNDNLPYLVGSGTTGISIWKHRDHLYISNVGDSKAFVVSVDTSRKDIQVIYSTKPHKPDDPVERKRIEGVGGKVQEAPAPGYSARLLIPMGDSPLDVFALAMSRSLGDFDGHPYGLIAEPTTDAISLSSLDPDKDYLIILASDGLLDRVPEMEIAREMVRSQLLSPGGKFLPLEAAEYLILKSSKAWKNDMFGEAYRDDISLAVHRLTVR